MSTNFPTTLDTSTELPVESDNTTLSTNHVTAHQNIQDAIEAIEAKVGVDSSAVTTSLDYLVKNTSSSNPGHKHTLANGATDVTASAAELNVLDGIPVTLTATEIGYLDGVTSAIQTQIDTKAADSAVVHDTGDETIAGIKTFSSDPVIPDEAYGSGWNGVLEPPTKNAVYDKIETLANFNLIPNTDVNSTTFYTYQIMPVTDTVDDVTNGWAESGVTITADTGGVGALIMSSTADASIAERLPGVGSNDYLRFADIGSNAIRVRFRIKLGTVDTGEKIGFGIADGAGNNIYTAHTSTADSTVRFLLIESTGDKLYTVTSNGTTNTNNDITSGVTTGNWNIYDIILTSTSALFYVNGTLKATHTTGLSTSTNSMYIAFGKDYNAGSSTMMTVAPTIITIPIS